MLILTIRTDKPVAELGLYQDNDRLAYETWEAHRQLAETLHQKIASLLEDQKKELQHIEGIVCFQGPGSFTGLRIGLSVGNALSYSLDVPIAAAQGDDWQNIGVMRLVSGQNDNLALPEYGAEVHITLPKR